MPDLSKIKHDRERQFAETFFDHDEWEYEPGPFRLNNGLKYRPDFHDYKRDVLIEVVGSRQAYNFNRNKYQVFQSEYPNFEVRVFDTFRVLNPNIKNQFYATKFRTDYWQKDMKVNIEPLTDDIIAYLILEDCTVNALAHAIGIHGYQITALQNAMYKNIQSEAYERIDKFLSLWRKNKHGYEPPFKGCNKVTMGKIKSYTTRLYSA